MVQKARVTVGAFYATKPEGVSASKALAIVPEIVQPVHRMETHVYNGPMGAGTGKAVIMVIESSDAKDLLQQMMGV